MNALEQMPRGESLRYCLSLRATADAHALSTYFACKQVTALEKSHQSMEHQSPGFLAAQFRGKAILTFRGHSLCGLFGRTYRSPHAPWLRGRLAVRQSEACTQAELPDSTALGRGWSLVQEEACSLHAAASPSTTLVLVLAGIDAHRWFVFGSFWLLCIVHSLL